MCVVMYVECLCGGGVYAQRAELVNMWACPAGQMVLAASRLGKMHITHTHTHTHRHVCAHPDTPTHTDCSSPDLLLLLLLLACVVLSEWFRCEPCQAAGLKCFLSAIFAETNQNISAPTPSDIVHVSGGRTSAEVDKNTQNWT